MLLHSRHSTFVACSQIRRFYRVKSVSSHFTGSLPVEYEAVRKSIVSRQESPQISAFVDGFRNHGHRIAQIDPLTVKNVIADTETLPELDPASYCLKMDNTVSIPDRIIYSAMKGDGNTASVSDLSCALHEAYCRGIGAEFSHLSVTERDWIAERMERREELYPIEQSNLIRAGSLMKRALELNRFLGVKFASVKRYSGEGSESMLVAVDEMFARAADLGVMSGVIGMPHRGRNDLLTCLLGHPIEPYLLKMRGRSEFPSTVKASGDTFSHFYYASRVEFGNGNSMDVSLLPNPSHLEAVTPVAVGKARSKMLTLQDGDYSGSADGECRNGDKVLCLLIHGDASVAGQGVVAETATIANIPYYSVGGSVHIVVNNQLGFTTDASLSRSFAYPTDLVAKGLLAPVFHVNGDDVKEVIRASRIAADYRQHFRRDVFLDLVCYRRWGHNELDDPSLTQPVMYSTIDRLRPLPELFFESLSGDEAAQAQIDEDASAWSKKLQESLRNLDSYQPTLVTFGGRWRHLGPAPSDRLVVYPTGVSVDRLRAVGLSSVSLPEDFKCHPTLVRHHVSRRRERLSAGTDLDWGTGEALAFGTLMQEGVHCRISGQDVGRGTFSHRHFMLVDQETDDIHIPLNSSLPPHDGNDTNVSRGYLEVGNSALSEEGVLSFEYGFSLEDPHRLVIWEAQFGDFFNSAQVPIDTYVASGETKWQFQSGLVMILPHGYDGAGPEHSSARIERFLQLTDSRESVEPPDGEDRNISVVNPTTPAQYFHLLRRQMKRPWRKPLVVIAPKLLLRHPRAVSSLSEMSEGTHFQHILGDPDVKSGLVDESRVRRVVLCSGKHFYALQNARQQHEAWDTALIRVEQLCPFPIVELSAEMSRFPNAAAFVWSQEEHRNMGAWSFVRSRVEAATGVRLQYVGRAELATPAVGIGEVHQAEIASVLAQTFSEA